MTTFMVKLSLATIVLIVLGGCGCNGQLSTTFYNTRCPNVSSVIRTVIEQARANDVRAGARLIRLHFHDCFVNGCDGSLLLDDAPGIVSEKGAAANAAVTGYNIVDDIKTAVEGVCPGQVSCADILALAAQISVNLDGGPQYSVPLGRRDGRTANRDGANADLPNGLTPLDTFRQTFRNKGLDSTDLVALSGAHTIGRARCITFRHRLYNFNNTGGPDPTLDATYLATLRQACPQNGPTGTLVNLDRSTPNTFDNDYFENLQTNRGLLQTDQVLISTTGSDTVPIVNRFGNNQQAFFDAFVRAIIKMGNIPPPAGSQGEVRNVCTRVN